MLVNVIIYGSTMDPMGFDSYPMTAIISGRPFPAPGRVWKGGWPHLHPVHDPAMLA